MLCRWVWTWSMRNLFNRSLFPLVIITVCVSSFFLTAWAWDLCWNFSRQRPGLIWEADLILRCEYHALTWHPTYILVMPPWLVRLLTLSPVEPLTYRGSFHSAWIKPITHNTGEWVFALQPEHNTDPNPAGDTYDFQWSIAPVCTVS